MKLPVNVTKAHKGKTLELDLERETLTLLSPEGEQLGMVTWEAIIDYVRASCPQPHADRSRTQPRVSLTAKVRFSTSDSKHYESRATGIGGGGLYIESNEPLPVGTALSVQLALPDRPEQWLEMRGTVAWVCPKPDQYTFFPGMGVRFTNIPTEARERVLALVNSLKRGSQPT